MLTELPKSRVPTREKRELLNLILFGSGITISLFGTFIYGFAMGLFVLQLTGSGLSFATTLVLNVLPRLIFNPLAGVLADRFNRKVLVVLTDFLNSFFLIVLYFYTRQCELSVYVIYISTFTVTTLTTIFDISFVAAIPNLVSKSKLLQINSLNKVIDSAAAIISPMIGGLIFALVDIRIFIIINGLSFLISALLELFIDFNYNSEKRVSRNKEQHIFKEIKDGVNYFLKQKSFIYIFTILITTNFFTALAISVPLPFIVNNVLQLGSRYFGIIQGSFSAGMIMGAFLIKKVTSGLTLLNLLLVSNLLLGFCMISSAVPLLFLPFFTSKITLLVYYIIDLALIGIAISLIDIPLISMLQKIIPDSLRGRVLSIGFSLGKIITPVALILAGLLINTLPPYLLPIAGGVALINWIVFFKLRYGDKLLLDISTNNQ